MRLTKTQKHSLFLALALGAAVPLVLNMLKPQTLAGLDSLPLRLLWIPFSAYALIYLIDVLRLRIMLRPFAEDLGLTEGLRNGILGCFFSNITPMASGGQPFQIYHLRSRGVPAGTAASLILLRFLEYLALSLLVSLWGFYSFSTELMGMAEALPGGRLLLTTGLILYTLVTLTLTLMLTMPSAAARILLRLSRRLPGRLGYSLQTGILQSRDSLILYGSRSRGALAADFLLGALNLMLQAASLWLLLAAVLPPESQLSFTAVFCGFTVLNTVAYFIPTPGGSGGVEGLYTLFFSALAGHSLGAAVLFWRFGSYYLHLPLQILTLMIDTKEKKTCASPC